MRHRDTEDTEESAERIEDGALRIDARAFRPSSILFQSSVFSVFSSVSSVSLWRIKPPVRYSRRNSLYTSGYRRIMDMNASGEPVPHSGYIRFHLYEHTLEILDNSRIFS